MDNLWKWVMHLNAKVFCLAATIVFFVTAAWCGFKLIAPPEPFRSGDQGMQSELSPGWEIGLLGLVSNQLETTTLAIPVDPFRPTIEAIFTNETERAAFLKALKAAQSAAAGAGGAAGAKKEDPFAHLRKKDAVPGALVGPDGQPMIVPKISFLGFFQRPDGTQAAMFHDSAENTAVFYDAGKQVRGVDILSVSLREAVIRLPDGTTQKLEIGGKPAELPAEPAKAPPKKIVQAAQAVKPGQKGAAAPQQRPNQRRQ